MKRGFLKIPAMLQTSLTKFALDQTLKCFDIGIDDQFGSRMLRITAHRCVPEPASGWGALKKLGEKWGLVNRQGVSIIRDEGF